MREPNTGAAVAETRVLPVYRKRLKIALELAVEKGKLRPYEALECAEFYGLTLEPSIQRAADRFERMNAERT